jgi:hypothetical protein
MVRYIARLLTEQDCVIIPEVGGLVGNYQPARVDMHSGQIFPPAKQIAFNRNLIHNDGLLANRVSVEEGLTYGAALEKVKDFARQCMQSLEQSGSCVLEGIGRLYYDADKRIQFTPMLGDNFLADAYGLPALALKPVQRYREAAKQSAAEIVPLVPNVPVTPARWLYAIMGSVAILALIASFALNLRQVDMGTDFSSIFPVPQVKISSFSSLQPLPVYPVMEDEVIISLSDSAYVISQDGITDTQRPWSSVVTAEEEVVAPVASTPFAGDSRQYHTIVVGAFTRPVNAEKFSAELSAKGYNVRLLHRGKYKMVAVMLETSQYSLIAALDSIKRSVHDSAWVLQ